MLHTYVHTVRFAEVDPARILYFSRVAEHCHAAYEGFVAAAGLNAVDYFGGVWKAPIVKWEVDYLAPSVLGETLAVHVAAVELGRSSLTLRFEVHGPDGRVRTRARMVAVFVAGEPLEAQRVPEPVAAAFRRMGATG